MGGMNRRRGSRPRTRWSRAVAPLAALALVPMIHRAAIAETVRTASAQRLEVTLGKSVVVESPLPIVRASLANPDIADAVVLSPRQVYVTGVGVGVTNLTLWKSDAEVYRIFDIAVGPDVSDLKEQIYRLFPEETGIRVSSSRDHLTVSGVVSSPTRLAHVLSVAEAYAPEKVVNLLMVGGVQQVMLEVRVAEMNRELIRHLGFNFGYLSGDSNEWGVTTLNDLSAMVRPDSAIFLPGRLTKSSPFGYVPLQANSVLRWNDGHADWTAFIDALKETGLVKILAEPTLVALSGQEANFLAGGEFPVPVPQALGTLSIEYKKFGVGLVFTPTVLGDGVISMKVAPEMSELDFTNAVVLSGFLIPALSTRRASTVVELKDGQSFAIAGLLRSTVREKLSKYPMLGDVPILGALFRSSEYQKNETELIILVTPRLVRPLDSETVSLPTEGFLDPGDFEFFGMGKLEAGASKTGGPLGQRNLEGEFGHVNP